MTYDPTPVSIRALCIGQSMIERALFGAPAPAPAPTPAIPDVCCRECGESFALPVIARCPYCASTQVRRLAPEDFVAALANALGAVLDDPENAEARSRARELLSKYDASSTRRPL